MSSATAPRATKAPRGDARGLGHALVLFAAMTCAACDSFDRFGTGSGSFEGTVEPSDLVRVGFPVGTTLCLELDTARLQSTPGALSTTDGRFAHTALRPMPPLASDTLSNLTFADGQVRNLLFAARASETTPRDVLAIVSLLDSGRVEVRLVNGAPGAAGVDPLYGVFALQKKSSRCSY
jgi:hypothetical protein